jgi:Acyl-CoA dehydrogenase, C-terminal domain
VESALLRAKKMAGAASRSSNIAAAMTGILANNGIVLAEQAARRVVAASAEGDLLRTQLAILRRLARYTPVNAVALSRAVAAQCAHAEKYPL